MHRPNLKSIDATHQTEQIEQLKVNGTVYIAGLAPDTTEDQIIQYFGQIGIVKRQKQKRGYPDQWPYKLRARLASPLCVCRKKTGKRRRRKHSPHLT